MMRARQYITVFLCLATALRASAQIKNVGWWNSSVFYQIYPRSFMDGDKDDGIGDLKGITSKLEHFVDIGVKGIWLSPINKSPMADFGYDISDFLDIQPEFGTMADLDALLKRTKDLGLKVILDLVPNHTSDKHEWFQKSIKKDGKYKDYYIWVDPVKEGDKIMPPNNWLSVFGKSAWTYNEERKQFYFHQFLKEQPDLNYRNLEVQSEMQRVIEYWLSKGIDGFRIDAVPHLYEDIDIKKNEPKSKLPNVDPEDYASLDHIYTKDQNETYVLVQKWRNIVDSYAFKFNEDEKVIMTEAYTTLNNTLKFYEAGSHIPFNFKFITEVNSASKATDFKTIIDAWIDGMPEKSVPNWVMGNHDRKRTATRYPDRADQMTMLAMMLPGVAVTYYGEEIGMVDNNEITWDETQDVQACNAGNKTNKWKEISRDPCRTPFQWNANENAGFSNNSDPWLPINKNYKTLNLEQQKKDEESHYKVYKALTGLRSSSKALQTGSYESRVLEEAVLIVTRASDDELLTLAINFSDKEQKITVSNLIAKKLAKTETLIASVGSKVAKGVEQKDHIVKVPAKASIILRSTYENEPSGVSETRNDSLLTVLLLWIVAMALRS